MDRTAVIIGSGNVATHLAAALDSSVGVCQVYSPHIDNARSLASRLKSAEAVDNLGSLRTDSQYYIIAVKDDAIAAVAREMPRVKGIVAHTSGSVPIDALDEAGDRTGVFYPLQTFSKDKPVDMRSVPMFVEGTTPAVANSLKELASRISDHVYEADSARRRALHIAAVYGCNFCNHLLGISDDILREAGYTLDVLRPLLLETIGKAMDIGPKAAQTGPAARGDLDVIGKHMAALDGDRREIYSILTQSIMKEHNHKI